jgi:glyoxylase-like metal-dependent hydrolase (beta-lactamase superfamily II)/rhodanese-related sulfurtransferase
MRVEQLYTGCLAEAAYYIESDGEAVVIDPLRDVEPYLELAKDDNAQIKYILETHFHADFVSGHIELAKKSGGTIVFGPTAQPGFSAHVAQDGEILEVGKIRIKVLHTPGHTMESSTFLLIDENGKEHSIYTGDTLFIGDVGRPDLAVKSDLTKEDLAGHLYDSLHNKLLKLPDEVIVYPGHGAGSACGKKMSKETSDTLGNQKLFNYALNPSLSRQEFIQAVTDGLVAPPQYFPKNAVINKTGYESLDHIKSEGLKPLTLDEFEAHIANGALILDTRNNKEFPKGFIPGSIFIGIDDNFAPWVGALIEDLNQAIAIIADAGREEEVIVRLSRVGYDRPVGFLNGGFETWKNAGKPVDMIQEVFPEEMATKYHNEQIQILDVRKLSEFASQHVKNATNYPLDFINHHLNDLDKDETYYLHCAGGYRSVIASSILRKNGFKNLINVRGGFNDIKKTDLPFTQFVEVSSDL